MSEPVPEETSQPSSPPTWTLITNVSFVDVAGVRMWCKAVFIDGEARPGMFGKAVRQVTGATWGGLPVFTVWIAPDAAVELGTETGGRFTLFSQDGNTYALDGGLRVHCGRVILFVSPDDVRRPCVVTEIKDHLPSGDELDRLILPFQGGTNYPRVVWTRVPPQGKDRT